MQVPTVKTLPSGWADSIMDWIVNGTPEENKKYWDKLWKQHEERVKKLQDKEEKF